MKRDSRKFSTETCKFQTLGKIKNAQKVDELKISDSIINSDQASVCTEPWNKINTMFGNLRAVDDVIKLFWRKSRFPQN